MKQILFIVLVLIGSLGYGQKVDSSQTERINSISILGGATATQSRNVQGPAISGLGPVFGINFKTQRKRWSLSAGVRHQTMQENSNDVRTGNYFEDDFAPPIPVTIESEKRFIFHKLTFPINLGYGFKCSKKTNLEIVVGARLSQLMSGSYTACSAFYDAAGEKVYQGGWKNLDPFNSMQNANDIPALYQITTGVTVSRGKRFMLRAMCSVGPLIKVHFISGNWEGPTAKMSGIEYELTFSYALFKSSK